MLFANFQEGLSSSISFGDVKGLHFGYDETPSQTPLGQRYALRIA